MRILYLGETVYPGNLILLVEDEVITATMANGTEAGTFLRMERAVQFYKEKGYRVFVPEEEVPEAGLLRPAIAEVAGELRSLAGRLVSLST